MNDGKRKKLTGMVEGYSWDPPGEGTNVENPGDYEQAKMTLEAEGDITDCKLEDLKDSFAKLSSAGGPVPEELKPVILDDHALEMLRREWRHRPRLRSLIRASASCTKKQKENNRLVNALNQMLRSPQWADDCKLWSGKSNAGPHDALDAWYHEMWKLEQESRT